MAKNFKKAVHGGFAVVGGGVLVLTHLAATQPALAGPHTEGDPHPGLTDGTFSLETGGGPLRAVTMTVTDGRISSIEADYNTHNRKSDALNTAAIVRLRSEVYAEQSADDLDLVTGATVTSQQFVDSMQDLINQARG